MLCSKEVCDYLIQKFYEIELIQWFFTIAHRPSFENSYNAMWEWGRKERQGLNKPDESPPFTLSFAALLYMLMGTALQFFPANPTPPPPPILPSLTAVGKKLYQAARDFIVKSEIEETPDVARIEALLAVALFLKNEGRPGDNYTLTGQAIRLAQSMGMHREASKKWGLTPFEAEARRRLWWTLYSYDRFQNLAFGRPYVISDLHCDVEVPANTDILDLTENGPINIKPLHEPTDYTFHLLHIQLAKLSGEILDKCFAPKGASYDLISEMDEKLADLERNLPVAFRSPSPALMVKRPYLQTQNQLFLLEINWTRALLHRPYLLKKLGTTSNGEEVNLMKSRMAAINFSKKCISIRRDIDADIPKHYTKWFLLGFNVFDATANLCMAIHQDLSDILRIKELDAWVMQGREVLLSMINTNSCAPQGVEAIDSMRTKYLELLRGKHTSLLQLSLPYLNVSSSPSEPAVTPQSSHPISPSQKLFPAMLPRLPPSSSKTSSRLPNRRDLRLRKETLPLLLYTISSQLAQNHHRSTGRSTLRCSRILEILILVILPASPKVILPHQCRGRRRTKVLALKRIRRGYGPRIRKQEPRCQEKEESQLMFRV
ncbi:hypothetical protein BT69DRAFT_246173 [Atractiella rhizophila]|nr:hypothetical protein BT69DRAFT_246173 [Atractiella rhizophila]